MVKRNAGNRLPQAVVIGLDCMTGLQTARILARRGVPVIGIAKNLRHPCARTRECERVVSELEGAELVATLNEMAAGFDRKAVLFPCTDLSVLSVSHQREVLEGSYHVLLPERGIVELLVDKVRFNAYVQEQGFRVPRTFVLRSPEDAEEAGRRLRFPCVIKPHLKTPTWERHSKAKIYRVSGPLELIATYEQCSKLVGVLVAQEWVVGPDSNLFSCNCYFSRDSRPLVTFVSRKIRQWPPEAGTSCLGEECRNDLVLSETVRLFESVNYRGLGYLEMKCDERTGEHFVMEANVGRPTGRSAIAEAAGVDLLYAAYCDAVGRPLPPHLVQQYRGAKWIYWRRDVQSALHYWRRGKITLKVWWNSWRGCTVDALFCWRDPVPFLSDLLQTFGRLGKRKNSKKTSELKRIPTSASATEAGAST